MPPSLLLVRLGAIGDVVRCLPVLEILRRRLPRTRISWLVEPAAAALVEGQPALDQVLVFPRSRARTPWSRAVRRTLRDLRKLEAEASLDLHGILKSGLFVRAAGIPRRIGFDPPLSKEGNRWFQTETVPPPADPWRVRQFLTLAERVVGPVEEPPTVHLPLQEDERERVGTWLRERGLDQAPMAVLYPGSSPGAAWKRWPVERYRQVGQRLVATGEVRVVVAWGPGEEDLARDLATGGAETLELAPRTSLRELGHLLARARLYIGGDTGPAHLAGAAGTPVLGIYGPSDAPRNRPLGSGHTLLTEGPPLRPRPWTRSLMAERVAAISAHRVTDEALMMLGLF